MESSERREVWLAGLGIGGLLFVAGFALGRATAAMPLPWQGPRPPLPAADAGPPASTEGPAVAVDAGRPRRGVYGTGVVKGEVRFTGTVPDMKVPRERKNAHWCKDKRVPSDAVLVSEGLLQDVLVRLANDSVKGDYDPPPEHAQLRQVDCMYVPRILGVVAGQTVDLVNGDRTLHNVHTYKGVESWFNMAQVKGGGPIPKEMPDEPKLVRVTCDVHPWMRAFVVVSSHPFFAVTDAEGAFRIEHVPAGVYTLEAWHSRYGLKIAKVRVDEGQIAGASFGYAGTEPEPAENKDELKGLY